MGKQGKKKGGKKDQPSETSLPEPPPSTSAPPPPPVEEEEEVGLTGASRKKKEKKEKKEKALQALQALQASRKPASGSTSKDVSEAASEQTSRAQSEAPSEPSVQDKPEESVQPSTVEAPAEPSKSKPDKVEEVIEEFEGLGLGKTKTKRPRKKKTDATQPKEVAQQLPSQVAMEVVPSPSAPASSEIQKPALGPSVASPSDSTVSVPSLAPPPATASMPVQTPEVDKNVQQGVCGRGAAKSAGRGRSWKPLEITPLPLSSSSSSTSVPITAQYTPQMTSKIQVGQPKLQASPRSMEPVLCRYKIPTKIRGNSVPAVKIQVLVNYLRMDFKPIKVYRYDVNFSPDRPKKMLSEVFKGVLKKYFPKDLVAFDQMKNCYSLHELNGVNQGERWSANHTVKDQNGKPISFEVSLKFTGVVDLGNIKRYMDSRASSLCHPTEEIQCIDVILRQGALEQYIKAGRQFFKRPENPVDLGQGCEMWTGLFQSAIFTDKGFINIDIAHKGFPKATKLLKVLVEDFNLDPTRRLEHQRGFEAFASFVKGLKVMISKSNNPECKVHRREFVCNSLADPPGDIIFSITEPDGRVRRVNVASYFATEKKTPLKYPNLNCLWVGSRDKTIYFPIEVLEIGFGQALARQLTDIQISKMVKEAATPPDERLHKIKEVIASMKYSQNEEFKQFGLTIANKFYEVQAKVLKPPTLDLGRDKIVPKKGQWQSNRLLKAQALQSWGLIALDTDPRNDYDNMISMIINTGKQMGMMVSAPKFVKVDAKMRNLHSILMHAQSDVKFLFVVVSARSRDDYHKVKQMAEREVGVLTQCIKEMTARRMNPMTAKNILLKVNSKLMGINQALGQDTMPKCLKGGGVMIVGADVTHPSPEQTNVPSIAAVTASMDDTCYSFNIELSVQTPKKEMIVEFEDMMYDHLRVYKERNNNALPRKIFVFRDGVSEGQFAQVMNSELAAVHAAYQRMAGQTRKPEVLFLLVQKRHHTRLFSDGGRSHYNVEPGTVVDTDIVHASELDFYLVSHQAIKGTARPTRYHAVCNDGNIPDDEVEQLTYYLCHLYSRCMRSVSYPTPTYYAHLACLRARSLTHGERFDNKELEIKPKRLRVLDKMLQFSRMFFV